MARKEGSSVLRRLLKWSYSPSASSKSCSTFTLALPSHRPHLEKVLLVAQALLLLPAKLIETVVVPVKVDELVITLHTSLANAFADILQLLARSHDARFNELQLWRQSFYQLASHRCTLLTP